MFILNKIIPNSSVMDTNPEFAYVIWGIVIIALVAAAISGARGECS